MPSRKLYAEPQMPRWWDRLIIALSLITVAMLIVDFNLDVKSQLSITLGWIDLGSCIIFLTDFGWRLKRSNRRWEFVRRNWIDILGSIPFVGPLRAARAVRLVRLLRLLRIVVLLRRVLQRRGWVIPSSLRYIGYAAFAIWLAAGGMFYSFESGANANIDGFDDALWWSITTLSTVGYGDLYPSTFGGRVVAVVTMVLGVGVLGTLAGSLATSFVEARERNKKGLRGYNMKNHLLILGWNDSAELLVHEFGHDPRYADIPIVIVAELEETPVDDGSVKFVRGQPTQRRVLELASAQRATAAVVVAADPANPTSDLRTALTVGMLRRLNADVRISAQLVSEENRELLVEEGCSEVVNGTTLTSTMLARSVQDLGAIELLEDLLSNQGGAQLYRVPLASRWAGKSVREFGAQLLELEMSLVAVSQSGALKPAPPPGARLQPGDVAFIVAHGPPKQLS